MDPKIFQLIQKKAWKEENKKPKMQREEKISKMGNFNLLTYDTKNKWSNTSLKRHRWLECILKIRTKYILSTGSLC